MDSQASPTELMQRASRKKTSASAASLGKKSTSLANSRSQGPLNSISSNPPSKRNNRKGKEDRTSVGDLSQKNTEEDQENDITVERFVKSEPTTPDRLIMIDEDDEPIDKNGTAPAIRNRVSTRMSSENLQLCNDFVDVYSRWRAERKTRDEINNQTVVGFSHMKDWLRKICGEIRTTAKQSQTDIVNALEPYIEKTLLAHLSSMEEKLIASIDEKHQKMEKKMEEFMSSVTEEFRANKQERFSRQINCVFCRMRNHNSDECRRFPTVVDRKRQACVLKMCMLCQESIEHDTCPKELAPEFCKYCLSVGEECSTHHFIFCPRKQAGEKSTPGSVSILGKRPRIPSLFPKEIPDPK